MGGGRPDHDGRGGSGFVPGRPTSNKKEPLKFDSEYDFEHANEEFAGLLQKLKKTSIDGGEGGDNNKDETEKAEGGSDAGGAAQPEDGEIVEKEGVGEGQEGGDEDEGPPEVFYDKKKSFFDSISCEATERSKGRTQRPDWRAEKKLNKETFGTTGGGGGGYGWRGGYRGGGGFRGGYRGGRGGGGGGYYNNYRGGGGEDVFQIIPYLMSLAVIASCMMTPLSSLRGRLVKTGTMMNLCSLYFCLNVSLILKSFDFFRACLDPPI